MLDAQRDQSESRRIKGFNNKKKHRYKLQQRTVKAEQSENKPISPAPLGWHPHLSLCSSIQSAFNCCKMCCRDARMCATAHWAVRIVSRSVGRCLTMDSDIFISPMFRGGTKRFSISGHGEPCRSCCGYGYRVQPPKNKMPTYEPNCYYILTPICSSDIQISVRYPTASIAWLIFDVISYRVKKAPLLPSDFVKF